MKTRVYLRIAKSPRGPKFVIGHKPNFESLSSSISHPIYYPTVLIALDLEIPDNEFEKSRILLEAKIKETKPAVEIKQIEEIKHQRKQLEKGEKITALYSWEETHL